jgi:hypothetical protein
MNTAIKDYLSNLQLGTVQSYHHISLIPMSAAVNGTPHYVALADAMGAKTLTVTEVSEGGSVPQLLVMNDGGQPVLIIDGEELLGAKQNRVLNTSILLKERSRTVVPVSCTEQGRWAYASAHFAISDSLLERKIRSRKSRSVTASLAACAMPQSNQGEVWDGIHELQAKAKLASPTSAMHDVFKARQARLAECLQAFPCQPNQIGLLAIIQGKVAGFDVVSRPEVYVRLHERLVRSYVLDALLEPLPFATPAADVPALAHAFLASLEQAREEVHPSVGYGQDHRFQAQSLTGSALVHDQHLIHAAFLTLEDAAPSRRMRRFHLD